MRRLIESYLPIKEISAQASREKSIRHGHISTLHIWWARRPLVACRAAILGSLLPDPDDPECPQSFRELVYELLSAPRGGEDTARNRLLRFMVDFCTWEASNDQAMVAKARKLILAANGGVSPRVLDPFAGGGSIPLEALRLGCEAHALELNPVAYLILLCTLVYPQKYGQEVEIEEEVGGMVVKKRVNRLARDVERWGKWVLEEARKEIGQFYPPDPDLPAPRPNMYWVYVLKCSDGSFYIGQTDNIQRRYEEHLAGEVSWTKSRLPVEIIHWESFTTREEAVKREQDLKTGFGREWLKREYAKGRLAARQAGGSVPVAYLWARTVACPNPACGAEIPLVRQLWLANKANKKIALKMVPDRRAKRMRFEVVEGKAIDFDPKKGTMRRGSVTCPMCYQVAKGKFLRSEADAGRMGERMMAVVLSSDGEGKRYRPAADSDIKVFQSARQALAHLQTGYRGDLSLVPNEPARGTFASNAQGGIYGFFTFANYFNQRQLLTIVTFAKKVQEVNQAALSLGYDTEYTKALASYLALATDMMSAFTCKLARWVSITQAIVHVFARQAIPMVWDYAEANPVSGLAASWEHGFHYYLKAIESCSRAAAKHGAVDQDTATRLPWASATADGIITDPPYYDNVAYADLSDFFYVWLKRSVSHLYPELFATPLTPKREEIIVNPYYRLDGVKDKAFFETKMSEAFREIHRVLKPDGVCAVVFAHKTTSAWEALISGLLTAGLAVSASWPLHTERAARLRAQETASLASSVWLVCRHRSIDAGIGPWKQVQEKLEERVKERLDFFLAQGIKGADAFLSAIGPALEVFGRYERVERITGEVVTVGEFLDTVRGVVARHALARVLEGQELGAVDAPTAFYVLWKWTYEVPEPVLASTSAENEEPEETDEEETGEAVPAAKSANGTGAKVKVPFDDARKLAQAVGAEVDELMKHGGILQKDKEYVRLLGPEERKEYFSLDVPRYKDHPVRALAQPYLAEELAPQMSFSVDGRTRFAAMHPSHARPLTIIDGLHMAVLLWADHQQDVLNEFLEKSGMGSQETFWRVAQSLSNLLPLQSREKQLLDGLLGRRDVLERPAAARQANLFDQEGVER